MALLLLLSSLSPLSSSSCPGGAYTLSLSPGWSSSVASLRLSAASASLSFNQSGESPLCFPSPLDCFSLSLSLSSPSLPPPSPQPNSSSAELFSMQWAVRLAGDADAPPILEGNAAQESAFGFLGALGAGCSHPCDCTLSPIDAGASEGPLAGGCVERLGGTFAFCYVARPTACESAVPSDAYAGLALRECLLAPPPPPAAALANSVWVRVGSLWLVRERAYLLLLALLLAALHLLLLLYAYYLEKRTLSLLCAEIESAVRPTLRWLDLWLLGSGLAQLASSLVLLACMPWGWPYAPFGWNQPASADPNSLALAIALALVFCPMALAFGYALHTLCNGSLLNARAAMTESASFEVLLFAAVTGNFDALRLAPWRDTEASAAFPAASVIEALRLLPLLLFELAYAYLSLAVRSDADFLRTGVNEGILTRAYFLPPPDVPGYLPAICVGVTAASALFASVRALLRQCESDLWCEPNAAWEVRAKATLPWRASVDRVMPSSPSDRARAAGGFFGMGRVAMSKQPSKRYSNHAGEEGTMSSTTPSPGGSGAAGRQGIPTLALSQVKCNDRPAAPTAAAPDSNTIADSGGTSPEADVCITLPDTTATRPQPVERAPELGAVDLAAIEVTTLSLDGGAAADECSETFELSQASYSFARSDASSRDPRDPSMSTRRGEEPLWAAALRTLPDSESVAATAHKLRAAEAACKEAKMRGDPSYKKQKRQYYDLRRMLMQQLRTTHEVLQTAPETARTQRTAESLAAVLYRAENPAPPPATGNVPHFVNVPGDGSDPRCSNIYSASGDMGPAGSSPLPSSRSATGGMRISCASSIDRASQARFSAESASRGSPVANPPRPLAPPRPSNLSTPPAMRSPRRPPFSLLSRASWTSSPSPRSGGRNSISSAGGSPGGLTETGGASRGACEAAVAPACTDAGPAIVGDVDVPGEQVHNALPVIVAQL